MCSVILSDIVFNFVGRKQHSLDLNSSLNRSILIILRALTLKSLGVNPGILYYQCHGDLIVRRQLVMNTGPNIILNLSRYYCSFRLRLESVGLLRISGRSWVGTFVFFSRAFRLVFPDNGLGLSRKALGETLNSRYTYPPSSDMI